MPFNLTPDFIPIPGHLDDVTIIPVLLWVLLRFVLAQLVGDRLYAWSTLRAK